MAVKFRALKRSDRNVIGKPVPSTDRLDNFAAFQYGDNISTNYTSSCNTAHVRGIIDLTLPTFNYVLGASNMSVLRKILNIDSITWDSIVKYKLVYDKESGELIEPNAAYRLSDVLIGPLYVKKLIEEFDVEDNIIKLLGTPILKMSRKQYNPNFYITTTPTGYLLVDKYYLAIKDYDEFFDCLRCKASLGDIVLSVRDAVIEITDKDLVSTYYSNSNLRGIVNSIIANSLQIIEESSAYSSDNLAAIFDSLFLNLIESISNNKDQETNSLLSKYPDVIKSVTAVAQNYLSLPNKVTYYNGLGNKLTMDNLIDFSRKMLLNNSDSRLSYLLAINKETKEELLGMLNYYVVVVPQALHPKIEGREHKLTRLYAQVMNTNTELNLMYSPNARPSDVILRYQMLDTAVSNLQYKHVELNDTRIDKDDKSILERIKSKNGHIRKLVLGKRQDYSGRAVVCINPYLPIDTIRIPRSMLINLLTYHLLPFLANDMQNRDNDEVVNKFTKGYLENPKHQEELLQLIHDKGLLKDVTMYMGRQPTLHKQSLQGFFIEESSLNAIEVSPLVCPAFNMDFDGDQAHIEVPLSKEATNEVRSRLLTTKNLFLSKTGECTTEPRQDMLMGLYTCTRKTYKIGTPLPTQFVTADQVKTAIFNHTIKVWDTVNCAEFGGPHLAGDIAVASCLRQGDLQPRSASDLEAEKAKGFKPKETVPFTIVEVNKKTIGYYMNIILRFGSNGDTVYSLGQKNAPRDSIVGALNRLVELGFKIARIYSPNISLLQNMHNIPLTAKEVDAYGNTNEVTINYKDVQQYFYKEMETTTLFYNYGLETLDNYSIVFDDVFKRVNSLYTDNIFDVVDDDNGFAVMAKSGGRGSADNMVQMFACKGKVKKNSTESFNALIENSYFTQLTPIEHFVEAYGGRQGLMDKSLKTGDTGYLMRQMWHTAQAFRITCEDCGTNEGLEISKDYLAKMSTIDTISGSEDKLRDEVKSVFKHFITGRYMVGSNKPITAEEAAVLAGEVGSGAVDKITIRSPLTCKNPCCARCYGIDNATHRIVEVGTYVGVIAAQSVGEPGTQLTMKEFQRGGVASRVDVTSAFDKVESYVHIQDLSKNHAGYDPLAWGTGDVIETPTQDINMKSIRIEGCGSRSIKVPTNTQIKTKAVKGEGLAYIHGDLSIPEILEISGIEAAQKYLAFKLFYTYKSEVQISLIHFEILVASMTRHMIISTNRKDLRVGQYCTSQELLRGNIDGTIYQSRLLSMQNITKASLDALDSIDMEKQLGGLSRACLLGLTDTLTKPLNRIMVGKTIL